MYIPFSYWNPICKDCIQAPVIIDTQTWDKCNLNVDRYSDDTLIPQVTDQTEWANATSGAWCYHNNDPANESTYGKLYNGYAVAGIYDAASLADPGLRKTLAPVGKRIPTRAEWTALRTFLGGDSVAGGKMKEQGLCHWLNPNTGATNESGFSGLGAGNRSSNGAFSGFKVSGIWRSSTQQGTSNIWNKYQAYNNTTSEESFSIWKFGLSVRCLRD